MTNYMATIKNVAAFAKIVAATVAAIAAAVMVPVYGGGVLPVYAAENAPLAPPQAPTATPSALTIHGIACVDQDMNGVCSFDEARVPNVLVRTVEGNAVGVTDNAGEYSLRASPRSALEVTIPAGFRSTNGNLRKLRIQMDEGSQVDIALWLDNPYSITQPISTTAMGQLQNSDGALYSAQLQALSVMGVVLNPYYVLLAVLVVVLLLLVIVLALLLGGLKRPDAKVVSPPDATRREQPDPRQLAHEATVGAWQMVTEQMVADALGETISIDENVGILDAKAEPNPRFSVVTRDGRTIIFTTDLNLLRKAKIIRRSDRAVDISARSPANHARAGALWHQVLVIRKMWHVTPPSKAHWYVVERGKGKRVSKVRGQAISEMPFLRVPQVSREGRG